MTQTASAAIPNWQTSNLKSPVDHVTIRFAYLKPHRPASRAILLLNGRSEWIEKYHDLPQWMDLGEDILWVSMDHRGQGKSGGPRAHVESYNDYARDAAAVMESVAGNIPYAIVSHSMGGLIALFGTLHGLLHPKALALSSPLLALPNTPIPRLVARPLASILSHTPFGKTPSGVGTEKRRNFAGNPLTSSLQGFHTVIHSPHPYVSPTFGWVKATFDACESIQDCKKLEELQAPVRIIGGSLERVIDPAGWALWSMNAAKSGRSAIDFFRVNGGRHELLNETPRVRQQAVGLLRAWLHHHFL